MQKHTQKSGFTIFELLVSMAIITLISGIVFFNHSKFKSDTEITNLAFRMALAVRQAQIYSISVKQFGSSQNFTTPYGLHFKQKTKDSYLFFADSDNGTPSGPADGVYSNPSGSDTDCDRGNELRDSECIEKTTIGQQNIIKGWCGISWSGAPDNQPCFSSSDVENHWLDITFKRPNPDAIFHVYETNYDKSSEMGPLCTDYYGASMNCTGWALCLVSPQGRQKAVVVYDTGQISVTNIVNGSGVPCDKLE